MLLRLATPLPTGLPVACTTAGPVAPVRPAPMEGRWAGSCRTPMNHRQPERLGSPHRLTAAGDFAELRTRGATFRGAHCLLVALASPGAPTRVGFVASRRGVGGAVLRNRARRRLREIVRRRWSRLPEHGHLLMFVAFRSTPTAPHQDLASDVERVLTAAGLLAPVAAPADRP